MAYTTQTKVETYLGETISADLTDWITSAGQYIDNYCNRTFTSEGEETRKFDGDGTRTLITEDFYILSKVEIKDNDGNTQYTVDTAGDYYLYPSNQDTKWQIELDGTNAAYLVRGQQNVEVTANWGWQSVPKDIELAATKLVAGLVQDKISKDASKEKIGDYSITYLDYESRDNSLEVDMLLERYKRPVL